MCVRSVRDPLTALPSQVCQVSAQQPVQTELLMRYHQLQSRLATLKIENEEVRSCCVWPRGQRCSAVSRCARVPGGSGGGSCQWELPLGQLFWLQMCPFPSLCPNCAASSL